MHYFCLLNFLVNFVDSPEANGFLSDGHGYTSDDQLVPSSPEGADKAADGEEDEDDQWEQVGPKNKSVITRSVNNTL